MAKQKIEITAPSNPEIGIDTDKSFENELLGAAAIGALDVSSLQSLTQTTQNREQTYQLIDLMARDNLIAAILETYAEDTVETNDKGEVVWIESDNSKVLDYTNWLIQSLGVDKHLYQWAHCLITYGDVYLRLFRKSDVEEDSLFKSNEAAQKHNKRLNESISNTDDIKDTEPLNENIQLRIYDENDRYIPYVQMVDNPGEMFDLQKFGKTHGYVKSPAKVLRQTTDDMFNYLTNYSVNRNEVEIFDAMSFVHGCLEATNQRQPERIDIYLDNSLNKDDEDEYAVKHDSMTSSYSVKRGQSILYNSFKIWRELNLLQMSAMLNRLTKSSIVRILNIDVGDMSKAQIQTYLNRIKEKIEQKSAIKEDTGISEYASPGPIENTIYVPIHEGKGKIEATTLGGDFDPKSLTDIEYFRDELFGCLRGSMKIRLADGTDISIKEAAENPDKVVGKEINACNVDGSMEKTIITNALKTKEHANFIRFTLEDNSIIEVTPEHLMMLTDGSYKEARDVTEEDELMDIYYESKNKI